MENQGNTGAGKQQSFVQKCVTAISIAFLFLLIFLILREGFSVILLILAGVLLAAWFRGISYYISDKWDIPNWISLASVTILTLGIVFLIFWMVGSKVSQQVTQFQQDLPQLVQNIETSLGKSAMGQKVLDATESFRNNPAGSDKLMQTARRFFKTSFGVLGDIYVILFLALFFTAQPNLYRRGIVSLVPERKTARADEVLVKLGITLRNWLTGKVIAMIVVAVLTYFSLLIIGVPLTLTLAIIAGLLNFIPNFGPLLAVIPAILVAATQGMNTVWIVIILYSVIQVVESNLITPAIQKKLIQIPPALIIIAQLFMGVFSGALGLIIATPFVAILMVLTQELYIKDGLGKELKDR